MIGLNRTGVGTYWRMFHFARCLVQNGHAVTVVCMSPKNRWRSQEKIEEGVSIVETPDLLWGTLRSGWDLWDSLYRVCWLRSHDFDLIHAFETRPTVLLPALYARSAMEKPLFFDWADWFGRGGSVEERPNRVQRTLLRPVETFFEERFRQKAQGTTVICQLLRQRAIDLGVPSNRVMLIRNGANLEEIKPMGRQKARIDCGLPTDVPIIGYVGSIFQRDAELMARAYARVRLAYPEARLLLIGYMNRSLECLLPDYTSVIETGSIPYSQISSYLAACDLCWLPFNDSGANRGRWPLKLTDYMAAGRPVVASAVGDVAQVMREHTFGVVTEPNAEGLADGVLRILADPTEKQQLGEAARWVAENKFDWRQQADTLDGFYQGIIHQE